MQVTETLAEGLKRQFKVVLPAGEIDQKVETRLREISKTIKLPGFRPGKVPMPLLKQRYGTSVMGEVLEKAVQDSSSQAMNERGLRPAMLPKVEITAFGEGTDLEYTMAFELLPEITPVDFGTLEFERLKAEVGDAEIDKGLDRLKQQQRRTEPVAEARPAQSGDTVVIDFVGKQDGVAFEGGSAEGHHLELGSGSFIPGFEDQLVGMNAGETREITVSFPEGYAAANLAGKPAQFTVTLKELRAPAEVEVNEEFAKQFGLESVEALRNAVKEQMERDYGQASRLQLKRKLLDKLADLHKFEVPAGMVDSEFDAIWKQVEEAKKQNRVDPETAGKSEDDLKTEYRAIAERRVRLGLLLSEVGRVNNITVKEDELKRAVIDEARKYPGQERQVIEYFRKDPDAMGSLRAPIFEEKTVDFILEMAKLTDRTVQPSELFDEPEAAKA